MPAVRDGDRAGRVRRQVFEDDLGPSDAAPRVPSRGRRQDGAQRALPERRREPQVDDPGPAMVTSASVESGPVGRRATIASATARGGLPAPLAIASATFEAKSPCSGRFARSTGTLAGTAGMVPSLASAASACASRSRTVSRALAELARGSPTCSFYAYQ
jgi:hypothetical protein